MNKHETRADLEQTWTLGEENEEDRPIQGAHSIAFKIIGVVLLLAFIALALPWSALLNNQRIEILKTNYVLKNDPIVLQSQAAVVSIEARITEGHNAMTRNGTGFCISSTGTIITNRHVIEGTAPIKVTFSDGTSYYSKRVKLIDGVDLAAIFLQGKNLPSLSIDYDALISSGDVLTVIGNPLGF
jgi:S1-C subfamily serine protease